MPVLVSGPEERWVRISPIAVLLLVCVVPPASLRFSQNLLVWLVKTLADSKQQSFRLVKDL